jgi:UTP--glucose-1-phosphate uridylyltransferase
MLPIVDKLDVSKYGVISINQIGIEDGVYYINDLVKKPKQEETPSRYAIKGRYVM